MKKTILTFLVSMFVVQSMAQKIWPYDQITYFMQSDKSDNRLLKKQVMEQVITTQNKKSKIKSVYKYRFNTKGQIQQYENSKKQTITLYAWKNDTQLLMYTQIKKRDTLRIFQYVYLDNGMAGEFRTFDKSMNHLTSTTQWTYLPGSKQVIKEEVYHFNKRGIKKPVSRLEYTYYEEGKRKETRYYNHKNKLKHIYTYACDDKGNVQDSRIKEINYCTKKNTNADGTFYEIMETREKNKVWRLIYTYSSDSSLKKFEQFNLNGKREMATEYTYYPDKNINSIAHFSGKGKLKYRMQNQYNEKGLKSKVDKFNSKNILVQTQSFQYQYHP